MGALTLLLSALTLSLTLLPRSFAFSFSANASPRGEGPVISDISARNNLAILSEQGKYLPLLHPALVESIRNFGPSLSLEENDEAEEAQRIFHGRGGMYPGSEHLTLDWFPPVFLLSSFRSQEKGEHDDDHIDEESRIEIEAVRCELAKLWSQKGKEGDINLVYQLRDASAGRAMTMVVSGQIPEGQHIVRENGDRFLVNLSHNQNHGLFLDMKNGRQWVKDNSENLQVLNLFAYTCAFGVAALSGGAREVVNIDMAKGAMKIGQRNHDINFGERNSCIGMQRFLTHNIFKSWGKLRRLGPYGLIISDPPSYQKGSFVVKKDYGKIIRRLPSLLLPGGYALLCLNAPELDAGWLRLLVDSEAPELIFLKQLPNPSTFPAKYEERALKVLLYQLPVDYLPPIESQ